MNDRCPEIAAAEWTSSLREKAFRNRIPVSATLELTARCNMNCVHCYLGEQDVQRRKAGLERTTGQVIASLDEWAAAGTLYLLITGGEPMLRPDFPEVYRHACELGMLVQVFCNGTRVDKSIIGLFCEFPPRRVEVSVYGATAPVHEAVTQVPGSFSKVWKGIRLLHDSGIRLGLKTVVLTLNRHELEAMDAQAAELGVPFRYDAAVFPALSGGARSPLDFRISPEEAVACDVASAQRRELWRAKIGQASRQPDSRRLYPCGAGSTGFYADPFGTLSPCLLTVRHRYAQEGQSFREVWDGGLREITERCRMSDSTCFSGALRGACTHCPAVNYLETGDEEKDSGYYGETARLRHRNILEWKDEG
jgi:MoaA/NifB/PqqE/SkfB family radical SAM enzyme